MKERDVGGMLQLQQLVGALAGVAVLLLGAGSAHAITITSATLSSGTVSVSGSQAAKSVNITWETVVVTTSNKGGAFTFTTGNVPADCVGTLSDGVSTVDVPITGCTPPPPPPTSSFPATGQTACWDSVGTPITCAGTGQDGDVQAGAALSYTSNGDGTITHNNTGLVWEKKTDCSGGPHCVNDRYTWAGAFTYVAALNAANFAGHNDWRLPNVKELQSIVNYQNVFPAVSSEFNDCSNGSCTSSVSYYWSSSSYANSPSYAWIVYFYDGNVDANFKSVSGDSYYVRAVRGGS
jgi:hypothetical protein